MILLDQLQQRISSSKAKLQADIEACKLKGDDAVLTSQLYEQAENNLDIACAAAECLIISLLEYRETAEKMAEHLNGWTKFFNHFKKCYEEETGPLLNGEETESAAINFENDVTEPEIHHLDTKTPSRSMWQQIVSSRQPHPVKESDDVSPISSLSMSYAGSPPVTVPFTVPRTMTTRRRTALFTQAELMHEASPSTLSYMPRSSIGSDLGTPESLQSLANRYNTRQFEKTESNISGSVGRPSFGSPLNDRAVRVDSNASSSMPSWTPPGLRRLSMYDLSMDKEFDSSEMNDHDVNVQPIESLPLDLSSFPELFREGAGAEQLQMIYALFVSAGLHVPLTESSLCKSLGYDTTRVGLLAELLVRHRRLRRVQEHCWALV